MNLTDVDGAKKTITIDSITDLFFIEKSCDSYSLAHGAQYEKEQSISQEFAKKSSIYLNVGTMYEMVQRFLTEKKMSKKELAEILKISIKNLERILSRKNLSKLKPKISLPLIRLYCGTKWE